MATKIDGYFSKERSIQDDIRKFLEHELQLEGLEKHKEREHKVRSFALKTKSKDYHY